MCIHGRRHIVNMVTHIFEVCFILFKKKDFYEFLSEKKMNPIPIFETVFPIPSGQIPVPVTPIPISQPKNRRIPDPILPLHDPLNR